MVFVIPKLHPLSRLAAPPGAPLSAIDIRELTYEPFVLMYKTSTNRQISCFVLADHPTWDLFISHHKNSYVSNEAREFICLARQYWSLHLPRLRHKPENKYRSESNPCISASSTLTPVIISLSVSSHTYPRPLWPAYSPTRCPCPHHRKQPLQLWMSQNSNPCCIPPSVVPKR